MKRCCKEVRNIHCIDAGDGHDIVTLKTPLARHAPPDNRRLALFAASITQAIAVR